MGFRKLGLAPERLCAPLGVSASEVMDPAARLPSEVFWSLWEEADRLSGDPSLGLHLAQSIPPGAGAGVLGQLWAVSETGLDAVRHLARYQKLMADRLAVRMREDGSEVSLEVTIAGCDHPLARHVFEATLAGAYRIFDASMIEGLVALQVSFRHSPPPNVEPYERFFACPVEFRAPSYRLRLPLASLRQPMIAAQPRAEARLRDLLDSELRTIAPEFTVAVSEQVRIAIEDQQRPTQASVARRLGLGGRTLQRRLRGEGSSFRLVVDRERRKLALSMLRQPARRVVEVAHAIGFEDATSFAKAFRRWTGTSPAVYRAGAGKPEGAERGPMA